MMVCWQGVWGQTTTPGLQTLECIQNVKQAIVEQPDEDTMSSNTFAWLVGISFLLVVGTLLVW